ncbi:MAG: HEPN domain-containing protein [Candidatus Nanoarchaeia archaeon]|jgi:uncharacterized protein (UPF0332 family)
MVHSRNKVEWCLKKASNEGKKHRGLTLINPDYNIAQAHLNKAEHNLNVMNYLIKGDFADWAVNASFYAHYHCLLAMLALFGYESRNQECTFAAVMNLIEEGKLNLKEQDISYISSNAGEMDDSSIVELRERFQYGTETSYAKTKMHELFFETLEFIEKSKVIIEEIRETEL